VAGSGQISTGQAFQPVIVRVADSSASPNPVIAAGVTFLNTVLRPGGTATVGGDGETETGNPAMPVILKVTQSSATTDINGLASIVPSSSGFSPPVEVDVTVTAGIGAWFDYPLQMLPAPIGRNSVDASDPPIRVRLPLRTGRTVVDESTTTHGRFTRE
jgi:hypothetical protein